MKKTGFSLAEILIALAIVSVIATMGFTIAKRGIERAYDLYIFSGYKGLCDAISDANDSDIYVNQDSLTSTNDFINHIANLLSATIVGNTITAPNHITYSFYKWGPTYTYKKEEELPEHQGKEGVVRQQISIKMVVPARKTKSSTSNTVCFAYIPDDYSALPVPVEASANCSSTITSFPSRRDLLLFYIDDGISGRIGPDGSYTPRVFYSAQEAFCYAFGAVKIMGVGQALSCGDTARSLYNKGAVKYTDPRRG